MTDHVLELIEVGKEYTDGRATRMVLHDIAIALDPGEFVAVTGPSGAGKSTLLHIAAGLRRPDQGTVKYKGTDIYAQRESYRSRLRRQSIGFVFQEHHLLDVLNGVENVALPMELNGVSVKKARAEARAALELIGVEQLGPAFPPEMSGGERQRIAIARAIAGGRSLLLADEPTGALDSVNGAQFIGVIEDLCRDAGVTALLVTHNEDHAKRAGRVVHIVDGGIWA